MSSCYKGRHQDQYLVFSVGESRCYHLEDLQQLRIVGIMDIIRPPQEPPLEVIGSIEVKGKLLPLIDLRPHTGVYDEQACIIVMESQSSGGSRLLGVVVGSISE